MCHLPINKNGTGPVLTIARETAVRHHAEIHANSDTDKTGCTVFSQKLDPAKMGYSFPADMLTNG
jgi:signal transduction histidine kinase